MPLGSPDRRPTIGVFDSGFGGLTVMRALIAALPGADFIYIGDTARLPYGSKSAETVARCTLSAARFLLTHHIDLLVIACNTASALALSTLHRELDLPVIGVIDPGASAARTAAGSRKGISHESPQQDANVGFHKNASVLVLATEATVISGAYTRACAVNGLFATEKACPLLVPLVEEGWTDHPVTEQVAAIYLREALAEHRQRTKTLANASTNSKDASNNNWNPAILLLGCTHYPLLRPLLARTASELMPGFKIIDSADATAAHVAGLLPSAAVPSTTEPQLRFYATDSIVKFARLGTKFLGRDLGEVTLVALAD